MNVLKPIFLCSVLIFTTACLANSHSYMGCDWTIPASMKQIAENEYSNSIDENDLENWQPASMMFTTYKGPQNDYYQELNKLGEDDILLLEHPNLSGDDFNYVSLFVHKESFGISFTLAQLSIIKDDKMLVTSGLSETDAITLISGCAALSQIELHYQILQQVKEGYQDFLKSDHGMRVLVP